jgi:hypothetical protein
LSILLSSRNLVLNTFDGLLDDAHAISPKFYIALRPQQAQEINARMQRLIFAHRNVG